MLVFSHLVFLLLGPRPAGQDICHVSILYIVYPEVTTFFSQSGWPSIPFEALPIGRDFSSLPSFKATSECGCSEDVPEAVSKQTESYGLSARSQESKSFISEERSEWCIIALANHLSISAFTLYKAVAFSPSILITFFFSYCHLFSIAVVIFQYMITFTSLFCLYFISLQRNVSSLRTRIFIGLVHSHLQAPNIVSIQNRLLNINVKVSKCYILGEVNPYIWVHSPPLKKLKQVCPVILFHIICSFASKHILHF